MSKRRADESQGLDADAWMVTFSDLILLLLTFFVMLLTMSSMDTKKLQEMFESLESSPGLLDYTEARAVPKLGRFVRNYSESSNKIVIDQNRLKELLLPKIKVKEMEELMTDIIEFVDLSDDERGIVLSFQERLLFGSGKASINKRALPILESVAKAIESSPNEILIMGHTDNAPIRSKLYPSNWELSASRGLSVLEYFVGEKRLSPQRFSVGGYGPSRPKEPNETPENRAKNRRVEIIFKHP